MKKKGKEDFVAKENTLYAFKIGVGHRGLQ